MDRPRHRALRIVLTVVMGLTLGLVGSTGSWWGLLGVPFFVAAMWCIGEAQRAPALPPAPAPTPTPTPTPARQPRLSERSWLLLSVFATFDGVAVGVAAVVLS